MSEVLEIPVVESEKLAPITKVESEIIRMRNEYSGLTISGVADKKGFEIVSTARKEVKSVRVQVGKERKALVDDAVKWQRQVNEAANKITAELQEIESGLEEKENAYIAEVQKIKEEAELARQEKIRNRVTVIMSMDARFDGVSYGVGEFSISHAALEKLSDSDFQSEVEAAESEQKKIVDARIEAERAAKEEADRLEAQRLEQQRIADEQAAQAAELKRQQDAIDAEKRELERQAKEKADQEAAEAKAKADAIAAEEAKKLRDAEIEKARQEASEKAIKDAKDKAAAEAKAKVEADRLSKEKEARKLAKRPDIEKFNDMYTQIVAITNNFTFKTGEGIAAHEEFKKGLGLLIHSVGLKEI